MYRKSAVVLSVLVSIAYAGWVQEFTEDGIRFGNGFAMHIDEIRPENLSLFERNELRMDILGMGIGLSKIPDKSKLEIGIYYGDAEEGRGKKMGEMIVPILAGFKVVAVGLIMMAAVGGLVLQSLAAAKLSLAVSAILAISKFFGKQPLTKHITHHRPQIKYQELLPIEYPQIQVPSHAFSELGSVSAANFNGYANYPSPVHEFADSRAQPEAGVISDINDKQPAINLDEEPQSLHRRKYSIRLLNDKRRKIPVGKTYG